MLEIMEEILFRSIDMIGTWLGTEAEASVVGMAITGLDKAGKGSGWSQKVTLLSAQLINRL